MGKCIDGSEIVTDTVALTFDLVGFEKGNTKDVARAARKKDAEKAINESLKKVNKDFTKKFLKGKPITNDDAQKGVQSVGEGAGKAILEPAKRKLSEGLGCAWKRTPIGIWVDENDWVMYIIVPVVIGGVGAGSAYMYHARVGDMPAGVLTSLANPLLKEKKIGSLTLGASDITFKPSERIVEAKVYSKIAWKPLNVGFSLFGGVKDGELTKAKLESEVTYKGSGSTANLQLGMKTFIDYGEKDGLSHGYKGNISYDTNIWGRPLRFGAEASWTDRYDSIGGRQNEKAVFFSIGNPF